MLNSIATQTDLDLLRCRLEHNTKVNRISVELLSAEVGVGFGKLAIRRLSENNIPVGDIEKELDDAKRKRDFWSNKKDEISLVTDPCEGVTE